MFTDAELVCLAVAQVLLRYPEEHHWLRAAPVRVGHLFPRLPSQPVYSRRLRQAADLMHASVLWPELAQVIGAGDLAVTQREANDAGVRTGTNALQVSIAFWILSSNRSPASTS